MKVLLLAGELAKTLDESTGCKINQDPRQLHKVNLLKLIWNNRTIRKVVKYHKAYYENNKQKIKWTVR